jgi:hypothetical protein
MRCKNCGWDNPAGNVKCEKCNAPLQGSMVDGGGGGGGGGGGDTVASDGFDPKKTVSGCPGCGYPVKLSDQKCPQCGERLKGQDRSAVEYPPRSEYDDSGYDSSRQAPDVSRPAPDAGKVGGTVIGGHPSLNVSDDEEESRRKLVGFLVSYTADTNGKFFPLYEGKNYIGRTVASNICIQGDNKVSERHCSILYRAVDRKLKFKDEQSTNGTFVNGVLSDEGELFDHDIIQVGFTKLVLLVVPQ